MTHPAAGAPAVLRAAHSVPAAEAVAELVRAEYDLPGPVAAEHYYTGSNAHFQVRAGGRRYALRVLEAALPWNPRGAPPEAGIAWELELLRFLRARGVGVAAPVPRRCGALAGAVAAPEGTRHFSLFEWVDGDKPGAFDAALAARYGAAVAELHREMAAFDNGPPRYEIGPGYLLANTLGLLRTHGPPPAAGALEYLETVARGIEAAMCALPREAPFYAPVHGDVHPGNALRRGDGFAFIDFETAGHGWRIYDLASVTALWRMGWGPPLLAGTEPAQAAAAFVEGYHSVRPLRPEERAALEPFERARLFEFMGYWMAEVASGKQGSRNCVPHLETVLATLRAWDAAAAPAAAFRPASLSV